MALNTAREIADSVIQDNYPDDEGQAGDALEEALQGGWVDADSVCAMLMRAVELSRLNNATGE